MMLQKIVLVMILVSAVMFIQCGVENIAGFLLDNEGVKYTVRGLPRELKPEEVKLTGANNAFGLKLFKKISLEERDKNIFISPLSVSMALGMTYNGAGGATEEAMRAALEYGDLTPAEINESYRNLIDMLVNLDPAVQFRIANSLWYRLGFQVEQEFIDINRTFFDAEVSGLDFYDPAAKNIINDWVNQKTNGKIPDIIDEIKHEQVMFLINAIYFKGDWAEQFNPAKTREDDFYLLDGSTKTVSMMTQKQEFRYYSHQNFEAVDLPYGGKAFSMTVILPKQGMHIDDFISNMGVGGIIDELENRHAAIMFLTMPKFKLEYDIELNDVLKALGMEIAFDKENADFSKINKNIGPNQRLYIDEVKHKTFVDVNEAGTEAAAATSVGMGVTSAPPSMTIDRPFVFLIREKFSNTILFIGKIIEPVLE